MVTTRVAALPVSLHGGFEPTALTLCRPTRPLAWPHCARPLLAPWHNGCVQDGIAVTSAFNRHGSLLAVGCNDGRGTPNTMPLRCRDALPCPVCVSAALSRQRAALISLIRVGVAGRCARGTTVAVTESMGSQRLLDARHVCTCVARGNHINNPNIGKLLSVWWPDA